MKQINSELKEEWKARLANTDKVFVLSLNKNRSKFTIFYVDENKDIEPIEPYSTNKKELPHCYTIDSNDNRYFYAYGGGYSKSSSVVESLKIWLSKESLKYESLN